LIDLGLVIVVGISVATLVPAYVGLYLITHRGLLQTRIIAAFGVGLTLWYFFDTMGDATSLYSNYPAYPPDLFGGWPHFAVIATFAAGVAVLAILDHYAVPRSEPPSAMMGFAESRYSSLIFIIPAAIAVVTGIHGLGEGWDASSAVSSAPTNATSITGAMIQAFGNVPALVSYPIHKFLEALIIGAAYACYVSGSNGVVKTKRWHIPLLGALFGVPSVLGAAFGYYISIDTTYFYAFGVTSALYALVRLGEATSMDFKIGVNAPSYLGPKIFLAMAVGFFLLYGAALLH
jgi:hypothetical protein